MQHESWRSENSPFVDLLLIFDMFDTVLTLWFHFWHYGFIFDMCNCKWCLLCSFGHSFLSFVISFMISFMISLVISFMISLIVKVVWGCIVLMLVTSKSILLTLRYYFVTTSLYFVILSFVSTLCIYFVSHHLFLSFISLLFVNNLWFH